MSSVMQKIRDIEDEMARTQKNKATAGHLGLLKAKLAKLRRDLLEPEKASEGWRRTRSKTAVRERRLTAMACPTGRRRRRCRNGIRRLQVRRCPCGTGRFSVGGQIDASEQAHRNVLRSGFLRVHHVDLRPGRHTIPRCEDTAAGLARDHRGSQGWEGKRQAGHLHGKDMQSDPHRVGWTQTAGPPLPHRARAGGFRHTAEQEAAGDRVPQEGKRRDQLYLQGQQSAAGQGGR
eukprot:scaffold772_cov339-Pavlova_lutheri.AAC.7